MVALCSMNETNMSSSSSAALRRETPLLHTASMAAASLSVILIPLPVTCSVAGCECWSKLTEARNSNISRHRMKHTEHNLFEQPL